MNTARAPASSKPALHPQQDILVFDRPLIRRNRRRAAGKFSDHSFLHDWAAQEIKSRLYDINRAFPLALEIGFKSFFGDTPTDKVEKLVSMNIGGDIGRSCNGLLPPPLGVIPNEIADCKAGRDAAEGSSQLAGCKDPSTPPAQGPGSVGMTTQSIFADEEFLPFANESFDLVLGTLNLHTVNDLPGALLQIRKSLKPDGLFLASMLGGETLYELRQVMTQAEMNTRGGISPRIAPFADKQQMGALLQRAGFNLPVVDSDIITVTYDNIFKLFHDLRYMGEGNAIAARDKTPPGKKLFMEAARLYQEQFAGADGRITASFEIIFLTGWAPHSSQQKPLRPGSAETSLADALSTREIKTGDHCE